MDYTREVEQWRASMEASLRAEDGWLALAGLFWLHEGSNSVGASDDCDVILPPGTAPSNVGRFERTGDVVTLFAAPGVDIRVNGEPVDAAGLVLKDDGDSTKKPDTVTVKQLVMYVLQRGVRYAIRLRDKQHPKRQAFEGRHWYPVQPEYCVQAAFTPFETPYTLEIPNMLGDVEQHPSPGFASFELQGQQCRLTPTSSGGRLFFVVHDTTTGHGTYGGGRFLYADQPRDGIVTLDFNKLHSPPCAFTDFATCPRPPRENYLPVSVEAGEVAIDH